MKHNAIILENNLFTTSNNGLSCIYAFYKLSVTQLFSVRIMLPKRHSRHPSLTMCLSLLTGKLQTILCLPYVLLFAWTYSIWIHTYLEGCLSVKWLRPVNSDLISSHNIFYVVFIYLAHFFLFLQERSCKQRKKK